MEAGEASFWRIESMQPSSSSISHQRRHQPPPLTSSSSSSSVPTDSILISSPYVSPLIMFPPSPHQYVPAGSPLLPFPTLPHSHSWTQLLLNNEDRSCGGVSHYHQNPKKLENWDGDEEDPSSYLNLWPRGVSVPSVNSVDVTKQEEVVEAQISNSYSVGDAKEYCVTTSSSTSNMLDFSRNKVADGEDHYTDHHSSECNSTATKKARVSSSTQPPLKVRKEKLGDRITALHQLVSPFGKTDTASVLLEAIGYIRFLQGQIEALSSPYLGNVRTHHSGEHELAKDLRSRGLCLVPVACTQQVETEVNGAEFWAQAQGGGAF